MPGRVKGKAGNFETKRGGYFAQGQINLPAYLVSPVVLLRICFLRQVHREQADAGAHASHATPPWQTKVCINH